MIIIRTNYPVISVVRVIVVVMSSFRRYGGRDFHARHQITNASVSNASFTSATQYVGLKNTREIYQTNIDMNRHSLLQVQTIYFADGTSMSTSSVSGMQGSIGMQGATGAQGAQGSQGSAGSGAQGAPGPTGAQGEPGPIGMQGMVGMQGATGAQGSQGPAGMQGMVGMQGATGAQGSQGPPGTDGDSFWNNVYPASFGGIVNATAGEYVYANGTFCATNGAVSTDGTRLQGTYLFYELNPSNTKYQGYLFSANYGMEYTNCVINAYYDTNSIGATGALLGINTNSPGYTLDVNGTGHFEFDLIAGGNVSLGATLFTNNISNNSTALNITSLPGIFMNNNTTVAGTVTATQFLSSSDRRLKKRIRRLGKRRARAMKRLRPVEYRWKETGKACIGFIADEVQALFPELVTGEKNGEGIQRIDYSGLVAVAVHEIQQLQKEVKRLKARMRIRSPSNT